MATPMITRPPRRLSRALCKAGRICSTCCIPPRAVMSYGTDVAEVFLRAAAYVNRILSPAICQCKHHGLPKLVTN